MRSATLTFVVSCLLLAPQVARAQECRAAGMLVIAAEGDEVFVLLGRDRNRHWYEMFSGRPETVKDLISETQRAETCHEIAVRECSEESRGYWGRGYLTDLSQPWGPIDDEGFVFYRAYLEEKVGRATLLAIPVPEDTRYRRWDPLHEIADYAWVDAKLILQGDGATVEDEEGRPLEIHNNLKSSLTLARDRGWLEPPSPAPASLGADPPTPTPEEAMEPSPASERLDADPPTPMPKEPTEQTEDADRTEDGCEVEAPGYEVPAWTWIVLVVVIVIVAATWWRRRSG